MALFQGGRWVLKTRTLLVAGSALFALATLFLAHGQIVHAATITVNTTDDELNSDGDCSLREAIQAANTDAAVDACQAGSGADTISLPSGTYALSIAGTSEDANATGDLDITSDLAIHGAGEATTTVDGAELDRVFHVVGSVMVEIDGVTVRNGIASGAAGGGILNTGTLTLTNVTISDNHAPVFHGGGIANTGILTLNRSAVIENTARFDGGGILNRGTLEAASSPKLVINGSTVSNNVAGLSGLGGGGIFSYLADMEVTGSSISGNTTTSPLGDAGGIFNFGGSATLTNVTISGNSATGTFSDGGGIMNSGVVIFVASSAAAGSIIPATLQLTNVTVTGNATTESGGGIFHANGLGTVALKDTIVANNSAGDDCFGTMSSAGHNVDSDGTCSLTSIGDLPNTDPFLGPLADNGGPTQIHALLAGSPAIDAGSPGCPPPTTDQRGLLRFAPCDIGAFELQAIGGIATLPDLAASPAAASGSSGLSTVAWAAIGAAIAAVTLLAGGGAWYAVRRRP